MSDASDKNTRLELAIDKGKMDYKIAKDFYGDDQEVMIAYLESFLLQVAGDAYRAMIGVKITR